MTKQTGCYPGCFYYTDSCFRQDCKQKPKEPNWVKQRREDYYKRQESIANHPTDKDEWNK